MNLVFSALGLFIVFYINGCKETVSDPNVDPNVVTIGNQVWMTKNLDVSTFRNGDTILEASTAEEWNRLAWEKQPAWCYYENDPANGTKYGKLYNWYAVNDTRGLAPLGYHIPTDAEWTTLTDFLGKVECGIKLKSTSGWANSGNGSNSTGFNGLPSGSYPIIGPYSKVGYGSTWWSSTEHDTQWAHCRFLLYDSSNVIIGGSSKELMNSVRCIKD